MERIPFSWGKEQTRFRKPERVLFNIMGRIPFSKDR